jgi:hypothetical protein
MSKVLDWLTWKWEVPDNRANIYDGAFRCNQERSERFRYFDDSEDINIEHLPCYVNI